MTYRENLSAIIYIAQRDALTILGVLLVGVYALSFVHIQNKMRGIGYKTHRVFGGPLRDWALPAEYLKIRRRHGWSAWPAYLLWPCLALGIVSLVVGLF